MDRRNIKVESLKDMLYKAVLVKNDKTCTNSFLDELYDENPDDFLKAALVMCSYSKRNVGYRTKEGTELNDVKGLRCLSYGLPMLHCVLRKNPEKIYKNLSLIGVMFGGWSTVFKLWEYCIISAKFNMDKLDISQRQVAIAIQPACSDMITGPDFCKALPIIRNLNKVRTKHNKAWRMVGMYMRYTLIPGDKFKKRRMRMYQDIRKMYAHRITPYTKMDCAYFANLSPDELYEELINQPAFKFLWDGTNKNNFNYLTPKNYVHRISSKNQIRKGSNRGNVRNEYSSTRKNIPWRQGQTNRSGNLYRNNEVLNGSDNNGQRRYGKPVDVDRNVRGPEKKKQDCSRKIE